MATITQTHELTPADGETEGSETTDLIIDRHLTRADGEQTTTAELDGNKASATIDEKSHTYAEDPTQYHHSYERLDTRTFNESGDTGQYWTLASGLAITRGETKNSYSSKHDLTSLGLASDGKFTATTHEETWKGTDSTEDSGGYGDDNVVQGEYAYGGIDRNHIVGGIRVSNDITEHGTYGDVLLPLVGVARIQSGSYTKTKTIKTESTNKHDIDNSYDDTLTSLGPAWHDVYSFDYRESDTTKTVTDGKYDLFGVKDEIHTTVDHEKHDHSDRDTTYPQLSDDYYIRIKNRDDVTTHEAEGQRTGHGHLFISAIQNGTSNALGTDTDHDYDPFAGQTPPPPPKSPTPTNKTSTPARALNIPIANVAPPKPKLPRTLDMFGARYRPGEDDQPLRGFSSRAGHPEVEHLAGNAEKGLTQLQGGIVDVLLPGVGITTRDGFGFNWQDNSRVSGAEQEHDLAFLGVTALAGIFASQLPSVQKMLFEVDELEGAAGEVEGATEQVVASAEPKAVEVAKLEPYGGPGGGHHVPAKNAFEGAPGYDPKKALAIPNDELARLGLDHGTITGAQHSLYAAFAKSGAPLTWEAVESIETEALARAGMDANAARRTVLQAIQVLKDAGVSAPTQIPWGG